MNSTLKNAVIRIIGGKDALRDVYNHGADAGFPGFTYHVDTVAFYRKHRESINKMAHEMAEDIGEHTLDMVKSFRCLNNDYSTEEIAQVMFGKWQEKDEYTIIANALAWFALEEVAREIFDK